MTAFTSILLLIGSALAFNPAPISNLNFEDEAKIQEKEFINYLKTVERKFQTLDGVKGHQVVIKSDWWNTVINASSYKNSKGQIIIKINGGMVKHPLIGFDEISVILCHELGHHLAGPPKFTEGNTWASVEGQADFFATGKCFNLLATLGKKKTVTMVADTKLQAENYCKDKLGKSNIQCIRTLAASKNVIERLEQNAIWPIDFDTPDLTYVSRTEETYPFAQCRLDTMIRGFMCSRKGGERPPYCSDKLKGRPHCWFSAR